MKQLRPLFITCILLLAAALFVRIGLPYLRSQKKSSQEDKRVGKDMVLKNYGRAIDSAAAVFNVSPAYLKALCMLECGGMESVTQRYEAHVYQKLKKVKFGELSNYEHVSREMLLDANDEALKNLASSWGPFQLMGYKCLLLDIKVRDIRGDQAVYWAVKWIDLTYGDRLRSGKYKDAFHIHNAGTPYPANNIPKTYHPQYCQKGLKYMRYFEQNPLATNS